MKHTHPAPLVLLALILGTGCEAITEEAVEQRFDQDGDGFDAIQFGGDDCDDGNRDINPGAVEVCDGIDNDCSGDADTDALDRKTWYRDADEDGYGSPSTETPAVTCFPPDGFVGDATDCNDDPNQDGANINPQTVWYRDDDGDGYGDPNKEVVTCIQLPYLESDNTDCDDDDETLHPETEWWVDADADGYGDPENTVQACWLPDEIEAGHVRAYELDPDCNDTLAEVFPGAASEEDPSLCAEDADLDGYAATTPTVDGAGSGSDCDDTSETIFPGAAVLEDDPMLCAVDADGDGYGATTPGIDGVDSGSDCDDTSETIFPGAAVLEADATLCAVDADGDGYGATVPGIDGVGSGSDCDDASELVFPGAAVREADTTLCTIDADGDGYGATFPETEGVGSGSDCNDRTPDIFPGSALLEDAALCAEDADGDGYGAANPTIEGVDSGADCDDTNATIFPGALEEWWDNDLDDCSGSINTLAAADADIFYDGRSPGDTFGKSVMGIGHAISCGPASDDCAGSDPLPDFLIAAPGESSASASNGAVYVYHAPRTDSPVTTFLGSSEINRLGSSLAAAGDLDGDNHSDLIIGSQDDYAWVIYSTRLASFSHVTLGTSHFSTYITVYKSEEEGDQLGAAVASIGYFSGDGTPDIAMGAHENSKSGDSAGRVYIFPEADRHRTVDLAAARAWGSGPSAETTSDGPGFPGDPEDDRDEVESTIDIHISVPPPVWEIEPEPDSEGSHFGWAISGPGDLDGDGADELVIGAPQASFWAASSGRIYIAPGAIEEEDSEEEGDTGRDGEDSEDEEKEAGFVKRLYAEDLMRIDGELEGDGLGMTITGIGDFNGDGYSDLALAATGTPVTPAAGRVYVILGSASAVDGGEATRITSHADLTIMPDDTLGAGNFGASLAPAVPLVIDAPDGTPGDFDGDLRSDLLIGSPTAIEPDYNAGRVYLVYGGVTGTWNITDLTGTAAADVDTSGDRAGFTSTGANFIGGMGDYLGYSVSGIGDIDGDEVPDFLMGAPGSDTTGFGAGGAALVQGRR